LGQEEALTSAVLHADETGWCVNGKGHWLWCFTTTRLTYYLIDQGRGRPVLARFFRKAFAGILVTDFLAAALLSGLIVWFGQTACWTHSSEE